MLWAPKPSTAINGDIGDPVILFNGVTKSYDAHSHAVQNLHLEVRRNEFLTLLGPSGSGKTTTLMMLAGFESPTSGSIELEGNPIDHLPPHRREMGVVFQNYALFPHMTVAQNLAFPLEARGLPRDDIRQRVSHSLELVGLSEHASKCPQQLSGGQQQRIALGRALIFGPKIVLMDEPLSALDKHLRERMQLEIKALQRKLGVTVVFVTHDQSEALVMSDRVAVFNHGRLQQVATPHDLYEAPANEFIAGFIGENNLIQGLIASIGNGRAGVAVADQLLTGCLSLPIEIGKQAVLAVRPESISLNPSEGCANRLTGVVEEEVFLGDHTRLRIRVRGQAERISVKLGEKATPVFEIGSQVLIGWDASDCLVFPSSSER